jgi:hypothetical protein
MARYRTALRIRQGRFRQLTLHDAMAPAVRVRDE